MPHNDDIHHFGRANGIPSGCINRGELTNNQQIGTANCTLEQIFKVEWLAKKLSWSNNICIDLGSGFTYHDTDFSNGSLSYPECDPIDRTCGISTFIDGYLEEQGPPLEYRVGEWQYSMAADYDDDDIDVIYYDATWGSSTQYKDPVSGEMKFFHGLAFGYGAENYEVAEYGAYQSSSCIYCSRPMASSARFSELNTNTVEEMFEGPEEDEYSIGFWRSYNVYTESVVNIGGIPFLKITQYNNGGIHDSMDTTQLALPSTPSVTFYDYPS